MGFFASHCDLCATASFVTLTVPNLFLVAVNIFKSTCRTQFSARQLKSICVVTIYPTYTAFPLAERLEHIPVVFQQETGTCSLLVHHTNSNLC